MVKKIVLVLAFALILHGCSPAAPQQPSPAEASSVPDELFMQSEQFAMGESAVWPEYIPEDIPPIPADITQVWADEISIRIFFKDMSRDAFESYLTQLYQNGFSLEFVVYEQPGVSQENIERYIREGKYDAVRISKGSYKMYIEYGADMGTYDIDPTGFPESTVLKSKVDWPAQLGGILDPPADSEIKSIMAVGGGNLEIGCESENENLFYDYGAQLTAAGYTQGRTQTDQNYNVLSISYTKGNILVEIFNFKPGTVGIHYKPEGNIGGSTAPRISGGLPTQPQFPDIPTPPAMAGQDWPENLPKALPEFTQGKILMSMNFDEKTTKITIQCTGGELDDYRQLLLSSGFTGQGGDVFSGSDCTVTIETYLNSDISLLTITLKG